MSTRTPSHPPRAAIALTATLVLAALPASAQGVSAARAQSSPEVEDLRRRLMETERELEQLTRRLEEARRSRPAPAPTPGWLTSAPAIAGWSLFSRARLGIAVDTEDTPEGGGVLVEEVLADGPAARAGLEPGDVITRWNDKELRGEREGFRWVQGGGRSAAAAHLLHIARGLDPGEEVVLDVRRDDERLRLTVVAESTELADGELMRRFAPGAAVDAAAALAAGQAAAAGSATSPQPFLWAFGGRALWGDLDLAPLDAELGEYFGTEQGLLVLRTPEGDVFGLRAGDVILSIGEREPRDATHALRILKSYDAGETVNLRVMRRQEPITLSAEVPEPEHAQLSWSADRSDI
jgi:hypothetical protein